MVAQVVTDVRANIEGVEVLYESEGPKAVPHTTGAVVRVRATPGMAAPWLERVLRCDAARRPPDACAAGDHGALVPRGASQIVAPTTTGFAVYVRSRDPEVGKQIQCCATGLQAPRAPPTRGSARPP
jgi:hypothetical protein